MLKVGITGGIGSGKSTVCQVFATLGIPVFYADEAARYLMESDALLIDSIKLLFGDDVYDNGKLQRGKIGSIVFKDPAILERLNAIVHPATIRYANQWMQSQTSSYAIKEAAIFFESGSNKDMDIMIGVYAPEKLRILRVMARDQVAQEKILERVSRQMNEEEKMKLCDYVITNDDLTAVIPQVWHIHQELKQMAQTA
jgi:dephospho-CoA kinase